MATTNGMKLKRLALTTLLGATVALLTVACGGTSGGAVVGGKDPGSSSSSELPVNEDARAMLPAKIRDSGVLNMATSLNWPPFGHKSENGDAVGLDIDLIRGVAATLGLEAKITDIDFKSMVPSVGNGRFDVAMNQLEDTAERRNQAQFVHYYQDSMSVLTKGAVDIDPENLCGREIAATQGSSQVFALERLDEECVAAGNAKIKVIMLPDSASTILAVQSGRVESMLMSIASAVYMVQNSAGDLTIVPGAVPGTKALTGIVIAKDNDELAAAIQAATQTLVDSGWHQKLLDKYGIGENALKEITIGKD